MFLQLVEFSLFPGTCHLLWGLLPGIFPATGETRLFFHVLPLPCPNRDGDDRHGEAGRGRFDFRLTAAPCPPGKGWPPVAGFLEAFCPCDRKINPAQEAPAGESLRKQYSTKRQKDNSGLDFCGVWRPAPSPERPPCPTNGVFDRAAPGMAAMQPAKNQERRGQTKRGGVWSAACSVRGHRQAAHGPIARRCLREPQQNKARPGQRHTAPGGRPCSVVERFIWPRRRPAQ